MGNSSNNNVVNDQNENLIENNVNENSNITVNQSSIRNTMAIKNPFLFKKESLSIEKDSDNENKYYVKFKYDSLIDFNFNIILKAKYNRNNNKTLYESNLSENDKIMINRQSTVLSFKCSKGFDIAFCDKNCYINSDIFDSNYLDSNNGSLSDIVFEFLPIEEITEDPLGFYTICKVLKENLTENNFTFKLKVEGQRLRAQGFILEINDLFLAHREQGECLICFEKLSNTVLLPCRHSCCSGCAHGLRLRNLPCPMCKNSNIFFNFRYWGSSYY